MAEYVGTAIVVVVAMVIALFSRRIARYEMAVFRSLGKNYGRTEERIFAVATVVFSVFIAGMSIFLLLTDV